jgi:hypothetical protein
MALRSAAKRALDVEVKSEITAAVTLAGGLKGRRISIEDFADQFGLSDAARKAITKELKSPNLAKEKFQFDVAEFKSQVGYRSVELDNGGLLTAESDEFNEVFHREVIDEKKQEVRFSTKGKIVSERLRKAQ